MMLCKLCKKTWCNIKNIKIVLLQHQILLDDVAMNLIFDNNYFDICFKNILNK